MRVVRRLAMASRALIRQAKPTIVMIRVLALA